MKENKMIDMQERKEPLLSVIIPVYNTERFLGKCIDSVLKQSYQNIEVVIVNDMSPDKSEEIILEFMQQDDRIIYIKNERNVGLFQTRINGFKNSHGDYIASLDSDDFVGVDYYRLLINDAVKKNADITVSSLVVAVAHEENDVDRIESYRCRTMGDFGMRDIDLSGKEIIEHFLETEGYSSHWWIGCCKLYSRILWIRALPILEKLDSNQIMLEDLIFGVIFMSLAERYISSESDTYFYLKHPESSSMDNGDYEKFNKNLRDIATALNFLEDYLYGLKIDREKIAKFLNIRRIMRRTWGSMVKESRFTVEEKNKLYGLLENISNVELSDTPTVEDRYCYLLDTPFDFRINNIKLQIMDPKYEYIGFDIFDTLIMRPFFAPKDLFILLNYKFNQINKKQKFIDFAKIREEAEREVRNQLQNKYPQYEEVSLDEIYEYMHEHFLIEKEVLDVLKEEEENLELQFCSCRKKIKELYDFALYCGKKVICISDMYLPVSVIERMLHKCGYTNFDRVFVSSELRLTKRSGNLYKLVLSELNITPDTLFFMGDNWDTDCVVPRNMGVQCWLTPKTTELFENRVPDIEKKKLRGRFWNLLNTNLPGNHVNFSTAMLHAGIRCMLAVVANKYFDNPFRNYSPRTDFNRDPYYMGYCALGMHDFGIAMWLKERAVEHGHRCIHFAARDGYVVKNVYDVLRKYDPDMPESNYFYMSRKSLLPLVITGKESFFSLNRYINLENVSIREVYSLLRPVLKEVDSIENFFFQRGFFVDQRLENRVTGAFLKILADDLFDEKKMNIYRQKMRKYFSEIIRPNDAMFDIGYSGRAQAILSTLLGYHIDAYYIHGISDDLDLYELQGDFSVETFFDYTPSTIGRMRELIQSETVGSCIGYEEINGRITPIFEECKFSYLAKNVLEIMQRGAVEFAKDMMSTFGDKLSCFGWRYIDSAVAHEFFLSDPTPGDMSVFRIFYFEDDMFFGSDYVKKDMVTLWKEDLAKKKLLNVNNNVNNVPKEIKKSVAPVYAVQGEFPQKMKNIADTSLWNSIPITSNMVDTIHMSSRQRGGYYWLFDRKKFDLWLEEECSSKIKKLFVYKPYRFLKKVKKNVKHREVLYVATSSYNILCCILHKIKYYPQKKCTLLLSDWRSEFYDKISRQNFFERVIMMPDIALREYTKKLNRIFADASLDEKEKMSKEFMRHYEDNLPVDILNYKKIILCNDTMPIGSFLCENHLTYDFIEEGNGLYSDNTLMRGNVEKLTPLVERYLIDKHHILEHSQWTSHFYINYEAQSNTNIPKTAVNFNVTDILKELDDETLNQILGIFGGNNRREQGIQNACLILTYPLSQRLGLKFEEQYLLYGMIMDFFAGDKKIHLKPHPDDKGIYTDFEGIKIIPKSILAELVWYETKTEYDIAISTVSTSMGALKNYKNGIVLSRNFIEKKEMLFLYYVSALVIRQLKRMNEDNEVFFHRENEEEIFESLLINDLFHSEDINIEKVDGKCTITVEEKEASTMFISVKGGAKNSLKEREYAIDIIGKRNLFQMKLVICSEQNIFASLPELYLPHSGMKVMIHEKIDREE